MAIANGPTRLTAQRRERARREIEALQQQQRPTASDDETFETTKRLVDALLARARKALARGNGGATARVRVEGATLERSMSLRSSDVSHGTDDRTDAILDLA